jgi:hypothetical protein
MRTRVLRVLRSEQISDNITVFIDETTSYLHLKIKYGDRVFTIDQFSKKEPFQNVLFYFKKVVEKLKNSKKDIFSVIEFL